VKKEEKRTLRAGAGLLALLFAAALTLTACTGNGGGTDPADTSPSISEPSASTATEAEDTGAGDPIAESTGTRLKLALGEEVAVIDPSMAMSQSTMQMISLTNEGLVTFGLDGNVTYGLADNYTVSEDGLTYTFHIRDDAYWSNGAKVTSKDFLFSWQRLCNPETGTVFSFMLGTIGVKNAFDVAYGGGSMSELGISAPDDETFIVELDGPRSYFLYLIAMGSYFMPINEAFFNECGDQFGVDINNYLACGPFKITEWEVGGTSYTLAKNENYYGAGQVTCDEINFQIIVDAQPMMMAWNNGELDTVGLTGDYMEMYLDDPALTIADMASMWFLSFNTSNETLANANLRMALSLAIDKTSIVNSILNNGSRVADYIIPAAFAATSDGVPFREAIGNPTYNSMDKTRAAQLWDAAKAELGVETLTLDLLYSDESTTLAQICAFVQSEWQNTLPGLTINLVQTTYNNRLDLMGKHEYEIGFTRWYGDYPDALTYLDMWISSSQMNYGVYNSEAYDALYQQVVGELALNETERLAAQAEMEKIILGDAAICPLYQLAACALQNTDYNWVTNSEGIIQYKFVGWK
jgi:oligopeptide transport system substrate-binding protein